MKLDHYREVGDDPAPSFGRVQFDFDASSADDLAVSANDYVAVLRKDNGGWARVVRKNEVGFVPANFILEVTEAEFCEATGESPMAGDGDQTFEAIADYRSMDSTQVSLSLGDIVTLIEKSNDDWWNVRLGSTEGFAPASYLKPCAGVPSSRGVNSGGSGDKSFGVSMAPIDFTGGSVARGASSARGTSVKRPTAPKAPGGHHSGAVPETPSAAALADISPTERRRKEEEEMRRTMRRKQGGAAGGRPESVTSEQLLEDAIANNEKLKQQLQVAETALESTSAACSELNRQISRLSQSRSLDQCNAEFDRLLALTTALKREAAGGVRLADLAS